MTLYLHVGQCGVQLGQELWATLEREMDGASSDPRSQGSRRGSDGFSDFFDDHGGAHGLFVDSDSRVLERVSPCLATRGGLGAGAASSGGRARVLKGSSSGGGERASGGRIGDRGVAGTGGGGDGVRFSSGTHLRRCSASNLVAGRATGHSDLWAKAYFGPSVFSAGGGASGRGREGGTGWRAGEDLVVLTQEAVRRRAEAMDRLYGFSFLHSLAGGTGGGLTSALLQNLRDLYPKAFLLCCAVGGGGDFSADVFEESVSGALRSALNVTDPVLAHRGGSGPALGYSKLSTFRAPWSCLYAYNAALTVAYLQTFADAVVFKDNQQMLHSAALRRKRARGERHSGGDKATATESASSVSLSELNQTIVEDLLGLYLPTTNCRRRSSVYSTVWPEVTFEQRQGRALGSHSSSFSYSSLSSSPSASASSTCPDDLPDTWSSSLSDIFSARPFFPGDILTDVCPMDGAKFLDVCTVFHQDKKWAGGRAYGSGARSLSAVEQSTRGRCIEDRGQRDVLTQDLYSRQSSENDARANKGRNNASGNLRTSRHVSQDPSERNHGKSSRKGLGQHTKGVEVFSREEQDVLEGLEKQFHLLRPKFLTGTSRPNLSVASRLVLRGPFSGPVDLLSSSFLPTEASRGAHSPFLRGFARRFLRDHPHVTWNCASLGSSSSFPSSATSTTSSSAGANSPRLPATSSSTLSSYSSDSSFSHSSSSFASSSSSSLPAAFSPPLSFSFSSSAFLPAHRRRYSLTVCSNRCGIAENLRQIVEKGERAFAARAFWHWYERAGMEEDLLDAAFDTCRNVVSTYADLAEE